MIGIHTPSLNWKWQGNLVVIPALVVGWAFGWLFVKSGKWSEKVIGNFNYPVIEGFLGGVLLAVGTLISKDVLFSGEFNIQSFASHVTQAPIYSLIAIALAKTITTNLGFSLGWRGGTIFPAIFTSLAVGGIVAQLVGPMPHLTVTLIMAVALTIIIGQPIVSIVCLTLVCPVQFLPFVIVTTYLTHWVVNRWTFLRP
ncbi:chloride channel protein [Fructilactobacillus ixorae]|uniref:Chloride channel protein n=1 Tax=Fructilactobacillus ixorae TaxID=1750535 RepID=A0ABY5C2F3_9LACO|nr:chloride channel protein [Fructilactobacillus ixorae]